MSVVGEVVGASTYVMLIMSPSETPPFAVDAWDTAVTSLARRHVFEINETEPVSKREEPGHGGTETIQLMRRQEDVILYHHVSLHWQMKRHGQVNTLICKRTLAWVTLWGCAI